MQNNEFGSESYHTRKQIKMDERLKHKTQNHKTPRREKTQGESFTTLVLAIVSWIRHLNHRQQNRNTQWDYIKPERKQQS